MDFGDAIPVDRHSPATFAQDTRVFDDVSRLAGKVLGTDFFRSYGKSDATPGAKGLTNLFNLPPVTLVEKVTVLLLDGRAVVREPGQLTELPASLDSSVTTLTRPKTEGKP